MDVFFDRLAGSEFDDAFNYYEYQVPGLGDRFKEEVKLGVRRICESPTTWTREKGDIRRILLHKFPYKILYSIEDNYIYIIAIAHCHRRPDYWIDRIIHLGVEDQ